MNFFNTLNEALIAEDILDCWDVFMSPIQYGETRTWIWDAGTRPATYISIYRDERGMYERPIHYTVDD